MARSNGCFRSTGGTPDLILDAGPISGVLPKLVRIASGDGRRVLTVSSHGVTADELGVRNSFECKLRQNALGDVKFTVPGS